MNYDALGEMARAEDGEAQNGDDERGEDEAEDTPNGDAAYKRMVEDGGRCF